MKPSCKPRAGFTLVEIVLALGVASVFLVGIASLLSTGLTSSREASNDTRISLIVRDVSNRSKGAPMVPSANLFAPLFYTEDGKWIDPAAPRDETLRPFFGVTAKAVTPMSNAVLANSDLVAVIVEIHYPVTLDSSDNPVIPARPPKTRVTYYAATAAGNGWRSVDSTFVPKIEY